MIQRRVDWRERLVDAVDTAKVLPFMYGVHDCCTFAAHCVDAMCDSHIASRVRSHFSYSNEIGAARILREADGLQNLITMILEAKPLPSVELFIPGDVVLIREGDKELAAICCDTPEGTVAIAPGAEGMRQLSLADAVCVWGIG